MLGKMQHLKENECGSLQKKIQTAPIYYMGDKLGPEVRLILALDWLSLIWLQNSSMKPMSLPSKFILKTQY